MANQAEPVNILLSREEVMLILDLLQARSIPGIDADPLGPLTAEGQTLANAIASHGLRARELARLETDGSLTIHRTLLSAVGVCAYANSTIIVFHWPADNAVPARYFGHLRDDTVVAHTRPEDVLHQFSLLPSKEQLIEQVLGACHFEEIPVEAVLELEIPPNAFTQVRELATVGKVDAATEYLGKSGADATSAQAFVATFANPPRVSILQTIKQAEDGTVSKQDFTILQNGSVPWLVVPVSGAPDANLKAQTTTKAQIQQLLASNL